MEKELEVFVNRVRAMAEEENFEKLLFEEAVATLRAALVLETMANRAATLRANRRAEAHDNEYAYFTSMEEEEEIPPVKE